ncbi:MAG TPA: SPOR domain-containing protein [Bacteroidetes bacterium]|nr:SPOR domain-containing protein [Bacteroidota bacterium]
MPNYKKELTRLFQKYNPDKVKDVDALLEKFAGREPELIATIHRKYGGKEMPRRKGRILLILAIVMLLLSAGSWYAASTGMFDFGKPDSNARVKISQGEDQQGKSEVKNVDDRDELKNTEMDSDEGNGKRTSEIENGNKRGELKNVEMDSDKGDGMRNVNAKIEKETTEVADKIATRESKPGLKAMASGLPLEYGVQIGLFSVADNPKVRKMLGDAQLELIILPTDAGKYMYVVGTDTELKQARNRRDRLRAGAFPDAFVIGLRKGKRVNIIRN